MMKIYTKKGDAGETQLLGGTQVPKYDRRIMAYGTLDELNSHIGLVRSYQIQQHHRDVLTEVQRHLLIIGSNIAMDPAKPVRDLPQITEAHVKFLEKEIDRMETVLPELKNFILPGGSISSAQAHVARSVSRRAERLVMMLHEKEPVDMMLMKYLNRLSDYLFVLARSLAHDDGAEEIKWE